MADPRIKNLAKILVHYSVSVNPGDLVALRCLGSVVACMPIMKEVYREVIRSGGNPLILVPPIAEEFAYIYFHEASDEQLLSVDPGLELVGDRVDCDIRILGDNNTRELTQVDPSRQSINYSGLREQFRKMGLRASEGEFNWVLSAYPTTGQAQDAEMSLEEWENFVYRTTFADSEDPISKWIELRDDQERFIQLLNGKDQVRIIGDGIEIDMSVKGRKFINCSGKSNMPDGEIFTGPIEESVNDKVKFRYPCIWHGVEVTGVELEFCRGKVVEAHSDKNEEFLLEMINTDEGASYIGEFGIGTNYQMNRFTRNMLFDEKIGGTIHFALGRGFPETGSINTSGIHWDLLADMKEGGQIIVDGDLVYESGHFIL